MLKTRKAGAGSNSAARPLNPLYRTKAGAMYCCASETFLKTHAVTKLHGKAQLILTSPPFPLITKKRYGNLQGSEYSDWLAGFATLFVKALKPNGSIVMEIGNVWEPGRPIMSTIVLQSLLRFLEAGNLQLCQEFIWYNPAKLPSPAQWVNIERIRVKDAFTRIWWMSPTDRPKADNRRILRAYSESMKRLIRTGRYNGGKRPSEHNIHATKFAKDNSGAIPPNVFGADLLPSLGSVLKSSNTKTNDPYLTSCRDLGISAHPARMPKEIVEFFVNFLTEPNDLVLDPFAGSNTTGKVSETLGRRWLSIEEQQGYAVSSSLRFQSRSHSKPDLFAEQGEASSLVT